MNTNITPAALLICRASQTPHAYTHGIAVDADGGLLSESPARGRLPMRQLPVQHIRFSLDQPPVHGRLTLSEDGTYTYRPRAGYSGRDRFVFRVTNGRRSLVRSVEVRIGSARFTRGIPEGSYVGGA